MNFEFFGRQRKFIMGILIIFALSGCQFGTPYRFLFILGMAFALNPSM